MANQNFVVHNGLTVGPLTIDAATGSINTSGNISFGGAVGVDSIAKGDSSIAITDFGTNSTVLITIDNTARANVTSAGMAVTGVLNASGNILATGGVFNALNVNGVVNSTGNILGATATLSALNVNGLINTTGNILGAVGSFSTINLGSGTAATVADATALAIALGG